jgi:hypothetical protein
MMSRKSGFGSGLLRGRNKFVVLGFMAFIFVVVLLVSFVSGVLPLSIKGSYTNAYEGAKPSFAGITYNGVNYDKDQKGSNTAASGNLVYNPKGVPYVNLDGTSFSFKGDGPASMYKGLPKIVGEMTPVFVPEETTAGDMPSQFNLGGVKINNPFTGTFSAYKNPYKTYNWKLASGSSTVLYTMEEWKTKFYVSISANPDGAAAPFVFSEWDNQRYSDVTVWIELDISPTRYFEGQDNAYFCIAQVQLSAISYAGHSSTGAIQSVHNEQLIAVNPSSPSSTPKLSLNNFDIGGNEAQDPEQIYKYRGKALNPQYFGNKVFFPITLNNFGSQAWGTPYWDWSTQGDVVSFDFTITQFVVGQWTVKNIQPTPAAYGRQSSFDRTGIGVGFVDWIASIGSNPLYMLIILAVLFLVVVAVLFFLFPEAIGIINSGLRLGRKGASRAGKSIGKARRKGKGKKS